MSQVVIGDILPYTQATAILNQTVFGTNWTANDASDVVVYKRIAGSTASDVADLVPYPSGYSVAFIGALQQVQVTLVTPSAAGDIVTITRQTPADRMNLYTNTNFLPSMLNNDFGILTLVDQQAQLVDQKIGPRYNYSAVIVDVVDTILPILAANETWVKNPSNTGFIPYELPANGIAPADATYVTITDETSVLPNSVNFAGLSAGVVSFTGSGFVSNPILGTAHQIDIANPTGVTGSVTISISANAVLPGTAGMGIPSGTTAQRVTPTPPSIGLRFNTDLELVEYYDAGLGSWVSISNDTALLALLASHSPGEGASLIGLEGTGTVQDLADAVFVLESASAAAPNGLVLTAGSNITLTPGAGTLTIDASPGGGVNPGLINELAYYAAAGNTLSGLPTANSSVLVTDPSGVPSLSTTLPSGLTIPGYLPLAGGTMAGDISMGSGFRVTNALDPVSNQDYATKFYVDQTALSGTAVYAASAASLGTVTQSGAGVGATLTNAGVQATFALDGVNPPVGTNVLIKNTATGMTAANEGIYTVTNAGSGATNWVLTRATGFDTATEINNTGLIVVNNGSTLAGTVWYNSVTIVTVDTTNFSFSQFGGNFAAKGANSDITSLQALNFISGAAGATHTILSFTDATVNGAYWNMSNNTAGSGAQLSVLSSATDDSAQFNTKGAGTFIFVNTSTNTTNPVRFLPNGLAGSEGIFKWGTLGANRTYTFQDASGTLAFTASTFASVVIQNFDVSGTYTPTSGLIRALVYAAGAGGGSGGAAGAAGQLGASGGGGGGGYSFGDYTAAQIGANASVTIGAGGAAGTAGNNNGGNGGDTIFDPAGSGATMTAGGGTGGLGATSTAGANLPGNGGTGGSASGGSINISGSHGTSGFVINGATPSGVPALGGGCPGFSVCSANYAATTVAPNEPGQGAPGVVSYTGGNQAGQAGAGGKLIVVEFLGA